MQASSSWTESPLLQGSAAALIGGGVVLLVWWLTQRSERRRLSAARTGESVARVIEASILFTEHVGPFEQRRRGRAAAAAAFARALTVFAAREYAEHPAVGSWATARAVDVNRHAATIGSAPSPPLLTEVSDALAELSGEIAGLLVTWLQHRNDRDFTDFVPDPGLAPPQPQD